eukprot:4488760-Pleurochrysis_carterae.AAC.2
MNGRTHALMPSRPPAFLESALKPRLADNQQALSMGAVLAIGTVAKGVGKPITAHVKLVRAQLVARKGIDGRSWGTHYQLCM